MSELKNKYPDELKFIKILINKDCKRPNTINSRYDII